jgi:F420-dependent methylenetetrahydromethanopterin dehydrogenase
VEDPFENPVLTTAGIMTMPIAALVAAVEPEMLAKNMQATMLTMASPPRTLPTMDEARRMSRADIPPLLITPPAKTKKGMAMSGKLLL